jgi:FlaA1/EpsC-like NDP-sugar epimerase
MLAEHLAIEANRWSETTKVSVVRYGNVHGSRGSFTNTIQKADPNQAIEVTNLECTRFWITLEAAVAFIDVAFMEMLGGEIFVPRLSARRLGDMIPIGQTIEVVGLRKTEKLTETLITMDEVPRTLCRDGYFVIQPWPARGDCLAETAYRSDSHEGWGSD